MGEVMKLIEKLKEMFFERDVDVSEKPPSLFDRLRNVFFSAEFVAADLDRVPSDCKCEDAIAHLDGRCCCTITSSMTWRRSRAASSHKHSSRRRT